MKKIYFDGRPIRSPITGVANSIFLMLEALKYQSEYKPLIFLQSDRKKNKHIFDKRIINPIISHDIKFFNNILYEAGFNSNLFEIKNSIIHETYFARFPAKTKSNFLVSTIHDVIPLDKPSWYSFSNYFFSKKNFFRQMKSSDLVIFPSKFTAQRAQEIFKSKVNNVVIPWPISDEFFLFNNSYVPDQNNPFFLVLGNIEPRKNILFAARLVSLFNKKNKTNIKLVVAGKDGFNSNAIKTDCLKIYDNIIFTGYISNDKKIDLLRKTACLLFPSKYEGFGIPLIEALVIGTPFLTNLNTSLTELSPKRIFGFRDNSLDDALHNLEKIVFISLKTHLGHSKYNKLCLNYSLDKFKIRLLNAYKNLY